MPEEDGIDLYDRASILDKTKIVICSANINSEPYVTQLERGLHDNDTLIELTSLISITGNNKKVKSEVVDKIKRKDKTFSERIYGLTSDQFYNFSADEKIFIAEEILKQNRDLIETTMEDNNCNWLLFSDGKVYETGSGLIPTIDKIYKISQNLDSPVFLFTQSVVSEESSASSEWRKCKNINGQDTFYPHLETTLQFQEKGQTNVDFDTGTLENFISEEYLLSIVNEKEQ